MAHSSAPDDSHPEIERRLATILISDVVGYSRMMGENEERTVRTLRGHREIFDGLLKSHRGRVFNTAGDAILAEFPSAVEAVRCATEVQNALRTRNDHLPPEERMWFRIGINLGDVIVQGGDLLGDGVNVAARIQTIAEPGGVCISGSVYDQIQNKLTLQIRQLGEKNFKNIAQPIRTFSIEDDAAAAMPGSRWRRMRKGPIVAIAVSLAVLLAAGAGAWLYVQSSARAAEEARRNAGAQRVAEAQRKAEQEKAALANTEREAKLLAELQLAKDALNLAEASKRKAEQDRVAAEAAQRDARLQSELRSAKEAQQRAEALEKKANEDRKASAEALRIATAAVKAAEAKAGTGAGPKPAPLIASSETATEPKSAPPVAPAQIAAASSVKGAERFDGAYAGRMCSVNADGSPRCWSVGLSAQHGVLKASWASRYNNLPAHATGTISADGDVKLALDGHNAKGTPMTGSATGHWENKKITVAGEWSNRVPVDATWTWSSSDPDAAVVTGPTAERGDGAGFNGRGSRRFRTQ
jgi:class 3 adenylate cyclase